MLKNYIIVAWRNLLRNKAISAINILGLSLGLTSVILILLSVANELSFDQFHEKKDRIYAVWNRNMLSDRMNCWPTMSAPVAPAMKQEIPEVKDAIRMTYTNPSLVSYKDKKMMLRGSYADPGFLTTFSFPLLKGDAHSVLNNVSNIVLTESAAKKLFGNEEPMNKIVKFDNTENLVVTGIIKDLPNNTSFYFEYLVPWENLVKQGRDYPYWGNNFCQTFVELKPGASEDVVNSKIKNMVITHANYETKNELFLHNIKKWELYSKFENGKIVGGRIDYVRMIATIAAFILLIACINFMNLSTARSERRAKEVAIRKVIGATKKSLIWQFIIESMIITFISLVVAIILAWWLLPFYNSLVHKQLALQLGQPAYWICGVLILVVTGFLAGSYPAFYLSSFQPIRILKSSINLSKRSVTPRRLLVVFQFIVSIALIICTIIIQQQIMHAKERPTGYNGDNIVYHYFTGDLFDKYESVKQELLSSGVATNVCETNNPITQPGSNTFGVSWEGSDKNNSVLFDLVSANDGFTNFFGIKLVAGRDLDVTKYPSDTLNCIINESAAKVLGYKDPVGRTLTHDTTLHIVGVFKDFIWGSPFAPTAPMIVHAAYTNYNVINVRLNTSRPTSENLKIMEQIFKKYNPAFPFEYHFVDDNYAKKFIDEQTIGTLARISAALAILISCLGLFGLAAFTAEKRTKEIGIRRVIGASLWDIVKLLSKEFIILVGIAALIAFPIAWLTMNNWLQGYAYRVTITIWVFVISGISALAIAVTTVSLQAIKAAKTNPVKSLRSE